MAIESIPTFGESSENTSGSEAESETTSTLTLSEAEIEAYTDYEAFVDMGRYVAKMRKHDESEDLVALFEWIVENKEAAGKACKELSGNLPMFRAAIPVEDRTELGYYVLPSEKAAKVGIDYDSEDHLLFPVIDGEEWTPNLSLGRATYVEGGEAESESETESGSEAAIGIDALTVAEIRSTVANVEDVESLEAMLKGEKSGKARKTAIEAIEPRISAVSEAENEGEDESTDESEKAGESESMDVEEAKVEALKALTETLSKTTEILETL